MYALMIYSLKVGACLAVFYLFFKLFLSRETFHRLNRIVVLGAMVLSFVLPLCVITIYHEVPVPPAIQVVETVSQTEVELLPESVAEPFAWEPFAVAAFLVGVAVTLLSTCRSVWCVICLIRRGRRELLDDKTVLVSLDQAITPFSWWRYIVLSEKDLAENGDAILLHEKAHLHLRHSFDLLVTDLAGCLQWFNPAMWLLRRELRAIHEYEADEAVLNSGIDAKQYQLLLIKKAAGGRWYSVANSFNHSKLKTRITMMLRKRSSRWAGAKMLLLLPLTGLALGAFAHTAYVYPDDKGKKETIRIRYRGENSSDADGEKRKPLFVVDGRAVSNLDTLSADRIESIEVLKDSASRAMYGDRGKDGVVMVLTKKSGRTTVVSAGNETLNDVVVVGSGNHLMGEVQSVNFKTGDNKNNISVVVTDSESAQKDTVRTHVFVSTSTSPASADFNIRQSGKTLFILDGKESNISSSKELDHNQIASWSILTGDAVKSKYPKRRFDHVVEITSKAAAAEACAEEVKTVHMTAAEKPEVSEELLVLVKEASLKAAAAGIEAAYAGLELARSHMPEKEWKEAKAELDKALQELNSAGGKVLDNKLRGQQISVKVNNAAVANGKLADLKGEVKSVHWSVENGVGMTDVERAQEKQGKTIFKGTITLNNPSEIPDDYVIFINGKKTSKSEVMRIPAKKIKRMELFRGEGAVEEFGEGVRGGVRITTRR